MTFNAPQGGRPKATEGTKRILLRESTFCLWNKRKESLNIKGLSNSEFAEILLHQNLEELRARCSSFQETRSTEGPNHNEEPINICYCKRRFKKKKDFCCTFTWKSRTELTTRFTFVKGTAWDVASTGSSFLRPRDATGEPYIFKDVDGLSSTSTSTLNSRSIFFTGIS